MILLTFIISCTPENSDGSAEKPKPITNAWFEPIIGGCIIYYDLPKDESVHSVKAEYTLSTGQKITRASSFFSDSMIIDGFNDDREHEVKLSSVNFDGVSSDPYVVNIRTLGSQLDEIVKTFKISPNFSSAKLTWNNETGIYTQIVLEIITKDKTVVQTEFRMNEGMDEMWIRNLSNEEYSFVAYVKDRYGNMSPKADLGSIIPFIDYKLDKSNWTHVPDSELPEGMENADFVFQEGRLTKFWDDIIDLISLNNLNIFYSSQGFPFSYFIDLGRNVKMSKVRIWQRENRGSSTPYYYTGQNVKTFELWISKDKINWEMVRRATILVPPNPTTALEEARTGHEFIIYDDDPHFTPEFRYLQFKGIESFGMEDQYACLSEITLYGVEEIDF